VATTSVSAIIIDRQGYWYRAPGIISSALPGIQKLKEGKYDFTNQKTHEKSISNLDHFNNFLKRKCILTGGWKV
jgi:hypothetical protein